MSRRERVIDTRKCRNWQTSKTKDLVFIANVWVQVPSSASKISLIDGFAGVAELADAQASGACGSNIVWVQVPSSALFFYSKKETDTVSFFSVLMIQKTSDNGKSSMWFHYRNEFRLLSYIPAFSDKNKDLHISHRQLLFSFWH